MKLSIIVPCFNSAGVIDKLLYSLKNQNHNDVEVLFIDDGSVDDTGNIIKDFAIKQNVDNFFLKTIPNSGAAYARTYGLKHARGEYVFFCDSDDVISSEFISDIFKSLNENPDMVFYSCLMRSDMNNETYKIKFAEDKIVRCGCDLLNIMLSGVGFTAAVWSFVFRKKLCTDVDATFTDRKAHEDHLFTIKMITNAKKISILKKAIYIQYVRNGSLTNSRKDKSYFIERIQAYEEARRELLKSECSQIIVKYDIWNYRSIFSLIIGNKNAIIKLIKDFYFLRFVFVNAHNILKCFFILSITRLSSKMKRFFNKAPTS